MVTGKEWLRKVDAWLGQWRLLGVVLLIVAMLAAWAFLPIADRVDDLQGWIDDFGIWGPPIFVVIYVIAVILLAPGSALTVAAGVAYGTWGIPWHWWHQPSMKQLHF